MRFFFNLVVSLLTVAAAAFIAFGGALQVVPGTGSVVGATQLHGSPLGWRAADMRLLMESNRYKCGIVTNEAFEYDAPVHSEKQSSRGTAFERAVDTIEIPTERVRRRHEAADYLWCDLGNVKVVKAPAARRLDVRDIFVVRDGVIVEFHVLTRVVEP